MRTAIVTLMLVLGSVPTARAQNSAWADKLFKGVTEHDFGNVPRGAQLHHRFYLTNIYAVDLQLINVRTSCGCVTATPATKVVRTKQTTYIDVNMDARKFTGAKAISIYVTVGPEYVSTATLKVSANSRADVVFNPGQINFGVVAKGQKAQQVIDVEYAGVLAWQVTEVSAGTAPLDVALAELYRRPGQVGYRLTVTLKPEAPAGQLKYELHVKTNDKLSPVLPVLVEATVQAALSVSPTLVALDRVKVNEARTQKVIVRGNKPFRILAVAGQGDGVSAAFDRATTTMHIVTVTFRPAMPGSVSKPLQIKTDLDGQTSATVTVEATAAE